MTDLEIQLVAIAETAFSNGWCARDGALGPKGEPDPRKAWANCNAKKMIDDLGLGPVTVTFKDGSKTDVARRIHRTLMVDAAAHALGITEETQAVVEDVKYDVRPVRWGYSVNIANPFPDPYEGPDCRPLQRTR